MANLCEKIYDYDGEMLQLDDQSYEAPFYPGLVGEKNRRKAYSIFSAVPEGFMAQTSSRGDMLTSKNSVEGRKTKTPIYIEELTMSKFIEDYLDFLCIETSRQFKQYTLATDKKITAVAKVMHDISMLLEIDRVIFKSFNALVAKSLLPEREKIAVFLEPPEEHAFFRKLDGDLNENVKKNNQLLEYFMCFIEESLRFIIMGFFKRCRIITTLLEAIKRDVILDDSRESIFFGFLANNLRWCFMTIQICIEKGGTGKSLEQEEDMFSPFMTNLKQNEGQVLNKLDVFKHITDQVVSGLSNC